jgi:hypothetical protein
MFKAGKTKQDVLAGVISLHRPAAFVRNHTQLRAESGEQVTLMLAIGLVGSVA